MSTPDDPEAIPAWRTLETIPLEDCKVFRVERRRMQRPSRPPHPEREGDFFVIRSTDWVNIVALTEADELVLIEQWRHGTQERTLEIPGGMIDEGESPLAAAQRELLEETGFTSDRWESLGRISPNPATHDNRCHTFLALDAVRAQTPSFDTNELCRLVLRPAAQIPQLVMQGQIDHALVVVALFYDHLRRTQGLSWSPKVR